METQSISTYEVIDSLLLQVQNMATESVIMSSDFSKLILETHKHSEVWQSIKKSRKKRAALHLISKEKGSYR